MTALVFALSVSLLTAAAPGATDGVGACQDPQVARPRPVAAPVLRPCAESASLSDSLTAAERGLATSTADHLKAGRTARAKAVWETLVTGLSKRGLSRLVDPTGAWIACAAFPENTAVQAAAAKVEYFRRVRDELGSHLNDVTTTRRRLAAGQRVNIRTVRPGTYPEIVRSGGTRAMGAADLDSYIADLQRSLDTTGEDAQLANLDLQDALQRQQQILQTMSNLSKMLHDQAMATVRKMK